MDFTKGPKKYGLEIRSKRPVVTKAKPAAIFGAEDDDEDEQDVKGGGGVEKEIARQAERKRFQKDAEQARASALAEDPNAFSYDEVYDDLHSKKETSRVQEQVERKPKYIGALLEKTKLRQQEREIVFERKLAKDRVKEDEEFGNKEKFVTRAYREKLEERKKWLEQEKMRDAIEAANDVTKRSDLSDLYRNLFHSKSKKDDVGREKDDSGKEKDDAGRAKDDDAGTELATNREKSKDARSETPQFPEDRSSKGSMTPRTDVGTGTGEGSEAQRLHGGAKGEHTEGRTQGTDSSSRQRDPSEERTIEREMLHKEQRRKASGDELLQPARPAGDVQSKKSDLESRGVVGKEQTETEKKPRVTAEVVMSAKERYLSRKKQRRDGE